MKSKKKQLFTNRKQTITALVVIICVAVAGVVLLVSSHAQSPYTSAAASTGALSGGASVQSGGDTANGSYVDFGGSIPSQVLGAYAGYQNLPGVESVGTLLGHPLTFASDYLDYHDTTNGWTGSSDASTTQGTGESVTNSYYIQNWQSQQQANKTNFRMVWGIPMLPNTYTIGTTTVSCVTEATTCWADGAAGEYNQYFKTVAQNLIKYGQGNAILRIGWEFNQVGEFPWSVDSNATAAQFVSFWQNIVTTMRSVPGAKFVFDWNPAYRDTNSNLEDYYPGDSYVDAIGYDVSDEDWYTNSSNTPQAIWNYLLNGPQQLAWLANFGLQHNKPLSLPEWGFGFTNCFNGTTTISVFSPNCPAGDTLNGELSGGDDAYYVQQIAQFIATHNFIEAGVWDYGNTPLPRAASAPNATAEFINDFK